ncbi:MAG: T9SS type A sorting domain-containing protein [Chlorobiales bacterium]
MKTRICLTTLLLFFTTSMFSQTTYTSITGGDFTNPGTWGTTVVDFSSGNSNFIIQSTHIINIDNTININNLTINSGGELKNDDGYNVTINGNITQDGTLDFTGGGTTTFSGTTTISGTGSLDLTQVSVSALASLTLGSNDFNVVSGMTVAGTANFTMGSGTLSLKNFTINAGGGTVSLNDGTIEFTGLGGSNFTFNKEATLPINNLTVNKSSGSLTFTGTGSNTFQINGTFRLSSNTNLSLGSGEAIAYNGNESTLSYNMSADRLISFEWPATNGPSNVSINVGSNTITLNANRTIPRNLTMTAGTLALGTNTLTINGSLLSSNVSGIATISATSVNFTTNAGVVVFGNGTSAQNDQTMTGSVTISALALNKDVSSGNIFTISGNPTISSGIRVRAGNFRLVGNTSFNITAGGLELLAGATVATPTVQIGDGATSGTMTINSGGYTQNAGTSTLSNGTLTINSGGYTQNAGTTTILNGTFNVTSSGTLAVNNGSFIVSSAATAITIGTLNLGAGSTYRTGGKSISSLSTFIANATSNFIFDGNAVENFLALTTATYGNVEIANTSGSVTVLSGNTAIVEGTLSFTADARVITSPNTGAGTLRIGVNGSISGANSNRFVSGSLERVINDASAVVFPVGITSPTTSFRPATVDYSDFSGGNNAIIRVEFDAGALPGWEKITGTGNVSAINGFYTVQTAGGTLPTNQQFDFTGRYTTAGFVPKSRAKMVRQIAPTTSDPTYELLSTVSNNEPTDDLTATLSALPTNDGYIGFASGGATVRWDGGAGDGFWTSAGNWDGNTVPGSLDDVILDNQHVSSDYTVNLNSSTTQEINSLTINSNSTSQITLQLTNSNAVIKLLSSGTALDVSGNDIITLSGTSSRIENNGGGTLSFSPSSIFNIQSTSFGALLVANYGNLNINNTSGTISVTGNIQAQTQVTKTNAGSVTITGDLTAPTITLSGGTLSVTETLAGNFNLNGGTFTPGSPTSFTGSTLTFGGGSFANSGAIRFSGTSAQTISGSGTFFGLEINNSSGVTMNNNITVTNTLTFTNGRISTGSNTLSYTNTSNTLSGSTSSFVDGILAISMPSTNATRFFPVGKAVGGYRPVEITQGGGSSPVIRVEMVNSPPTSGSLSDLTNISLVRYYKVDLTSGTISNPTVKLTFDNTETVNNTTTLRVARSTDNSNWASAGNSAISSGSGPPYTGTITSDPTTIGSTTFFALGSFPADNPLPVNMLSLNTSAKNGRTAVLEWETASEQDNLGFVLYRSETENGNFEQIASYQTTDKLRGQGSKLTETKYLYEDSRNTLPGKEYFYKLVSVDNNGTRHDITLGGQSVWSVQLPFEYALDQNYPNPFNPVTTIQFSLEKAGKTTLEIYNVLGQKVATLVNGELSAGAHRYQWNASGMASGIYFYRLRSDNFVATKKMVLVK